jgi:hypothetical protein
LASIADIPGIQLYSLQKRYGIEQLAHVQSVYDLGDQLDEIHGPFMDTAALITQLDLVITIDTSIAHLAGGLGKKVWVLLPYAADWRWMLDRTDSPWYPTMRLFRQQAPGDWDSVMTHVRTALCEMNI